MVENKFKITVLLIAITITVYLVIMSAFIIHIGLSYKWVKSLEHIGSEKYYKNLGVK